MMQRCWREILQELEVRWNLPFLSLVAVAFSVQGQGVQGDSSSPHLSEGPHRCVNLYSGNSYPDNPLTLSPICGHMNTNQPSHTRILFSLLLLLLREEGEERDVPFGPKAKTPHLLSLFFVINSIVGRES